MTSNLDLIRGRQVVQALTNQSGGAVIAGDVVIVSAANDESFTTTTSAAYNSTRVGVALESIAAAAAGRILLEGYAPLVNVSASATRGHYLLTHTVAKQATSQASYAAGAFGQIIKAGTTPSAVIFPVAQVGSAGVARSGATTDAHLAVWNGSNADSIKDGGVVPAAGGRTLIAEATPSGTNTVTFAAIAGTYKVLTIEFAARDDRASNSSDNLNMQFNADTTAANYRYAATYVQSNGAGSTLLENANSYLITGLLPAATATANQFAIGEIKIYQYANTGFYKTAIARVALVQNTTVYMQLANAALNWANTGAITQIVFVSANGNFVAGSVFRLYGES